MTGGAGLLRAILDAPDDDAARLVYADWLEERGDPRAEFIRLQCAAAQMADDDPRLPALQERERQLLAEHAQEWCDPLGLEPRQCRFRRGFVEAVEVHADRFLERPEAPFENAPVHRIHFLYATERIRDLARCPSLVRLTALDLSGNAAVCDPEVVALAASPHLSGLTSLDLSSCSMGQPGVESLANAGALRRLRRLRLAGCSIRRAGLEAILRSAVLGNVTELDVRGNHQCWVNPNRGEPYVTRTESNVGHDGVLLLAESPEVARLEAINVGLNEVEESGWEALVRSPHLAGVRRLNAFETDHVYADEGPPGDENSPYSINEEICDALCVAMPGATRRRIARHPDDPRFTAPPCTLDGVVVRRLRERFGPRVTFAPPAERFGALITSPLPDGTRSDWYGSCALLDSPEA
jgi:uncharacterized protein (TIGR02996 family)